MPKNELTTIIDANLETCFDLSRSIDLHQISTEHTDEKAIAGRRKGLIELGEFVTWEAKHFGIKQQLSSKITAFDRPYHFRDEQIRGAFKYIVHDHYFGLENGKTKMVDVFEFEAPFGILGKLVSKLILSGYLRKLLDKRNSVIKEFAETPKWKTVLPG